MSRGRMILKGEIFAWEMSFVSKRGRKSAYLLSVRNKKMIDER
jgi:hypothetical protein